MQCKWVENTLLIWFQRLVETAEHESNTESNCLFIYEFSRL